jgi:hypothetical protein
VHLAEKETGGAMTAVILESREEIQ